MAVTIDAPIMWRVSCDRDGCGARLYVYAGSDYHALRRAYVEYGWGGDDEQQYCRTHREWP